MGRQYPDAIVTVPDVRRVADEGFRYESVDIDAASGTVRCTYLVGGRRFEERVVVEGGDWDAPGVEAAASLVFLLSGVSYYKAFAPPVVDLASHTVRPEVRAFLRDYYVHGLGEFALRNDLDLRGLELVGGRVAGEALAPARPAVSIVRPLVPFGGGMDSIVSVELVRRVTPDAALFVVSRPNDRFEAIERAAAATGLPVLRATRELDAQILRSRELGFLNGHVPVTGILSAIAVLTAVLTHRDAVVMSNEWSSSVGNVERDGEMVNHQYSKSIEFERGFRAALAATVGPTPDYFSLLRPFTELWIGRRFAEHPECLKSFRSCNRAFHIDPSQRLDRWCGRCDKCAFIDLILSPFVSHNDLSAVFAGAEPLDNPALVEVFETLIGATATAKPFECVGDVDECRAAVVLASERPDRSESVVLDALLPHVDFAAVAAMADGLLEPLGEHFIPEPYASGLRLD